MFQFFISALFIIFLSSCYIINKPENYNRKTANEKIKPFQFTTVETEWLKIHPEIYKELTEIIESEKIEIEGQAKDYERSFPDNQILPFKLSVESLIEFNKKDPDIASIRLKFYTFTGGAHGMIHHVSWNWHKTEKRFLSLSDYIKTDSAFKNFKSRVKSAVLKEIDLSFKDENWIEQGMSQLKDLSVWNIDGDSLVLTFAPYQLAPYAAGSIEVSVLKP